MKEHYESIVQRTSAGLKGSITFKMIIITIVALLLLIPTSMIESLIYERESYHDQVTLEVSEKWGGRQVLSGPFLSIPFKKQHKDKDGLITYTVHYAHFLPEELRIEGDVIPQVRKRGIYEVALYQSKLSVQGNFKKPDFAQWSIDPQLILWQDARLSIGLSDLTGIQERIQLMWNGQPFAVSSGLVNHEVVASGITSDVPIDDKESFTFSFTLDVNGSQTLGVTPLGKQTITKMKSTWPTPSFGGKFLPDDHEVSNEGFTANWTILDLNRNYPQQWISSAQSIDDSELEVKFLLPVDEYQKNTRSVKYAILIITLTFLLFFLVEVMNAKRFHPIQYALIGFAITLFYVLLISITEHLGFNWAYFIASVLTIGLISFYITSVFSSRRLTAVATGALSLIYFFIYVILQLQDFSLIVGGLGLFMALSTLMILSRKINWYDLSTRPATD